MNCTAGCEEGNEKHCGAYKERNEKEKRSGKEKTSKDAEREEELEQRSNGYKIGWETVFFP